MICVPLTGPDTEATLAAFKKAAEVADLVELRLDCMKEYDLQRLLTDRPCPVIVTNRPVREGGHYGGDEEKRVMPLREAVRLGADYVDIEHDSTHLIRDRRKTKLIVSYHNFQETPGDLIQTYTKLKAYGADIVKVAVWAKDVLDNLIVFDLPRRSESPTIALCMGELGFMSRVLSPKFGSFLTFASLEEGAGSAPGQMAAQKMLHLYRTNLIKEDTKVYGLIGDSITRSPLISAFNAAFYECGLDARYLPFPVSCSLKKLVRAFKAIEVGGYSVLPPYQEAALEAVEALHGSAEAARKVDTIVNQDGRLEGYALGREDFSEMIAMQFRLWTGMDAPVELINGILDLS
jgi:3-dehydroquinate dehydratase/shikimate dehydrogenase